MAEKKMPERSRLTAAENDTLKRLIASTEAMEALMRIEGFRSLNQDIQSIINAANEIGAEYIVLEQDQTQLTQMESIKISMESFHKFEGLDW